MSYRIVYCNYALMDIPKLKAAHPEEKTKNLIDVLRNDPFGTIPANEKLVGDLQGVFSRRINIRHRLVYEVFEEEKVARMLSMWSHYEGF